MKKIKEKVSYFKNNAIWRTKIITSFTMLYNFVWSVGKLLFGIYKLSYIYILSGAYTILIGFTKRIFLTNHGKEERSKKGVTKKINKESQSMIMGVLILISGVAYGIYMGSLLIYPRTQNFSLIWSIFLAACSFVEFGVAIHNLFKVRRRNDILLSSLRFCSFVSAVYAIVLTQVALLSATGAENAATYNAITGIVAGVVGILVGTHLIVRAHRKNKEKILKNQDETIDAAIDTIQDMNDFLESEPKQTEVLQHETTPTEQDPELKD